MKRLCGMLVAALVIVGIAATPAEAATTTTIEHGAAHLALAYAGRPYVYGGSGPRGFDCSGLVRYVYRRKGLWLPRTADAMYHSRKLKRVPRASARRDDLVFWVSGGHAYHVALFIKGRRIVHTGDARGVRVTKWWGTPVFKRPRSLV